MNDATGLCEGCLRTLPEIAAWGGLGRDARLQVLAAIELRRARIESGDTGNGGSGSGSGSGGDEVDAGNASHSRATSHK